VRKSSRRSVIGGAIFLAGLLALGIATLPVLGNDARDFLPFTMDIKEWKAAMGSRGDGTPIAGTRVTRLEWTNVRNWRTTIIEHSVDPRYEGSVHEVSDQGESSFDALTRNTVGRVFGSSEGGREIPMRWFSLRAMDLLPTYGFTRTDDASTGTATFREVGRRITKEPTPRELVDETIAVYNVTTRLPLSVRILRDGQLMESVDFVVVN
jgi:hypothetical protein